MSKKPSFIAVKDFERFQHYKGRTPPWIKLYNALLDDYRFVQLSDAARGQLILIWLVASRHHNRIPNDREYIARAIHAKSKLQLDVLIEAGWLAVVTDAPAPLAERKQNASKALATCPQSAIPEVEEEKEVETETTPSLVREAEPKRQEPQTALPDSVMEWCKRQEKPVGWIAALVAMLKGVGAPGGKAATVDHLAEACSVADRLKGECTPARFNRILIRVMEPEYKSTGHGTDSEDAEFVKASKRLRHIASFHDPLRPKSLTAEGWKVVTPQEREALKNIGTIERVLTAKPEQWTWVVKDFMQAQRGAAA